MDSLNELFANFNDAAPAQADAAKSAAAEKERRASQLRAVIEALAADLEDNAGSVLVLLQSHLLATPEVIAAAANRIALPDPAEETRLFLTMQIRYMDSLAALDAETLLIYSPEIAYAEVRGLWARLRREFRAKCPFADWRIGIARVPDDAGDPQTAFSVARRALAQASAPNAQNHIVTARELFASPVHAHTSDEESALIKVSKSVQPELPTSADKSDDAHSVAGGGEAHKVETANGGAPVLTDNYAAAQAAADAENARRADDENMPQYLMLSVSEHTRMQETNALARAAGYEVRPMFDGAQTLSLLRVDRPDVLLLDYELKDASGAEIARRLRAQQNGGWRQPVVLLVPREYETDLQTQLGATDLSAVVSTPCAAADLLEVLREAGRKG